MTVLNEVEERINGSVLWTCQCECGNICNIRGSSLTCKKNATQSCGCLILEKATKHGLCYTDEYKHAKWNKRRELMQLYDSEWNVHLTQAIRNFFPACVVCGMTDDEHVKRYKRHLHIDHVYPLSKGNGLKPGNAVILCQHCNGTKYAKDLSEMSEEFETTIISAAQQFKEYCEEYI